MVCLHLFDRGYEGLFQPFFFFHGRPFSFYFAQLSDFCVMGFAFCTGYAHTLLFGREKYYKERLLSLLKLLIQFWLIIAVFSVISMIIGQASIMPGTIRELCGNVFLYNITYNGAWWYMFTYTLLVIISPVVQRVMRKCNTWIVLFIGFVIYCVSYYYRFNTIHNYFTRQFSPFGMTLFEYLIGSAFAKEQLFSKIYSLWSRIHKRLRLCIAMVLLLGMLYSRTLIVPSLFVAPVTGIVIITLFHFWKKPTPVSRFFESIGGHSTNIWLTHMFFFLYLFYNFVYIARYPLLIYALMLAITVAISYPLKAAAQQINRLVFRPAS